MVKKISTLVFAGLLALPALAMAEATPAELAGKIDTLMNEVNRLKSELATIKQNSDDTKSMVEEKAEKWDNASRVSINGDFRARLDSVSATSASAYQALNVARGVEWFTNPTTLSPFAPGAIAADSHTVAGSPGASFGTAGLLYGFFVQTPTSPTAGNPAASAGAAGASIGNILYGNPGAVTISTDAMGNMTGVTVNGTPTELSASQKTQNLVQLMNQFSPTQRAQLFAAMGFAPDAATKYDNDTLLTNRVRLDLRAKATENIEFKSRLAMYKAWGMENNPIDTAANAGNGGGPYMLNSLDFDGSSTRQPSDNALRVDRAYVNWNAIGGSSAWFSIGRRPTTDGPPAQLRMGEDQRMATPLAYMDYPFDGLTLGYAYNNLFNQNDLPGRIRFCYGRGFEAGVNQQDAGVNDTDFAGFAWDVYQKNNQFLYVQSYGAFNMFNVPDNIKFVNPLEFANWETNSSFYNPVLADRNLILDRANLGDIFHTSGVYMNKVQDLNYFLVGGWSRTKATGIDEMGTSLLGSWWEEPTDKDGYSVYAGIRYDIPNQPFKLGLEYNYGTKNWISFTPGNDDLYASKLATRGHVVEAYTIYDLPVGDAVSKFGRAFMRLGAQYYTYNYTGSGFWLGAPQKIEDLASDPMNAQFYVPVDHQFQVYLTMEAKF